MSSRLENDQTCVYHCDLKRKEENFCQSSICNISALVSTFMLFLKLNETRFHFYIETFLETETNSIVLLDDSHAIKISKVWDLTFMSEEHRENQEYINDVNRKMLKSKKVVYLRVERCDEIAECINISEDDIRLALYKRDDLEAYIESEIAVDRSRKAEWILFIIKTILHFHSLKVLIDDMTLRNILVADDLSLKMIDFDQCSLLSLNVNLNAISDNDLTAQVNIFHLDCVIYSIVIWQRYECNLFMREWVRSLLRDLSNVDCLFCENVIRKCWLTEYSSMKQLYCDAHESLEHIMREVWCCEHDRYVQSSKGFRLKL